MHTRQITIKDIAKQLNISSSTVSRALRDHPDISQETKKKVVSLANELDYQPDVIAQSLKNMRTNTIGVIVPEIKHHFFSSALNGIEDITYNAGYTIIVCKSNESYEREVVNTRALASNRIAGLIVSISQNTQNDEHFRALQRRNIPIVFFDRVCSNAEGCKVLVNDSDGAFRAVQHLISVGYKRIAHIAGPEHLSISVQRLEGYKAALRQNGFQIRDEYTVHGGLNEEDGIIGFQRLMQLNESPNAIFAVNDPVAIGVFMQIKKSLRIILP